MDGLLEMGFFFFTTYVLPPRDDWAGLMELLSARTKNLIMSKRFSIEKPSQVCPRVRRRNGCAVLS